MRITKLMEFNLLNMMNMVIELTREKNIKNTSLNPKKREQLLIILNTFLPSRPILSITISKRKRSKETSSKLKMLSILKVRRMLMNS